MTDIEPHSERGPRETWRSLMSKTRRIRDRIWGNEKIPDRDDDSE